MTNKTNIQIVSDTNMVVIDCVSFFSSKFATTDVVLCEVGHTKKLQAYIGANNDSNQVSTQAVAKWGAKLTQQQAEGIFGYPMPDYKS